LSKLYAEFSGIAGNSFFHVYHMLKNFVFISCKDWVNS